MIALAFLLGLILGNCTAILGVVLMTPKEEDNDKD